MTTLYVSPAGAGARSGKDVANAAALGALVKQRPERVLLLADQGDYVIAGPIGLSEGGGRPNAPLVIAGANSDGAPARVTIRGTRTGGQLGNELFKLLGAHFISFEQLEIVDTRVPFRVGAPCYGLRIADVSARNVYRFLENNASGDERDASLVDFALTNCSATAIERNFLRIQYASYIGWIDQCSGDAAGAPTPDALPAGCVLEGAAAQMTFRDCTMTGFAAPAGDGAYWNGDGFSTERGNSAITFQACTASDCADAGFDLKSTETLLTNCTAHGAKRNFRVWGEAELNTCASVDPVKRGGTGGIAHLWCASGARVRVRDFSASGGPALPYELEKPAPVALTGFAIGAAQ